jgi:serine phosphatase RsbU (regulator of sigma subunit)/tetratricopeptide (TPR) repeat protein
LNSQAGVTDIDSLLGELKTSQPAEDQARIYLALGKLYAFSGNDSSVLYFKKGLELAIQLEDAEVYARSCRGLGLFYKFIDPILSTQYAIEAIKYGEMTEDHIFMGNAYRDLGNLYRNAGDLEMSLELYNQAEEIALKYGDTLGLARSYNNIGIVHMINDEAELGLEFWKKSLELKTLLGKELSAAASMGNIAFHYTLSGDQNKAYEFISKALEIDTRYGDFEAITFDYSLLGKIYTKMHKYKDATEAFENAILYADSNGTYYNKTDAFTGLLGIYDSLGDYKNALIYSRLSIELYVSNSSDQNERITRELTTKFETEKKERENAELKGDNESKDVLISLKDTNRKYLIFGLILSLSAVFLIVLVIRKVRLAKKQIEFQKHLIEEKNHEITDSINYAKRLQEAILPTPQLINQHFKNNFVLYLPKDIVAGDFYWMEKLDESILYAVADCTGHGVPGAMVSVVCHNALNRAVREFKLKSPGEILDKVTDLVIETFAKSNEEVKDGMDISLCALRGRTLEYAGAQNPLWIISETEVEYFDSKLVGEKHSLYEIKGDKQPVGYFRQRKPFVTKKIELKAKDRLYMSTDGFADQFGGTNGKKMKTKFLKEFTLAQSSTNLNQQKEIFMDAFLKWRGTFEQLDDVCLIGLQIE